MIKKVISGFQTGVDIAAIRAASELGIPTGGFIPKGFKTLQGRHPEYAKLYNAIEHSSSSYKERTWDNVLSSDGTLRIASNFNSSGEKCTLKAILAHSKPYYDINIDIYTKSFSQSKDVVNYMVMKWIRDNKISVLNVAGNSEETSPGIEEQAEKLVHDLLLLDKLWSRGELKH